MEHFIRFSLDGYKFIAHKRRYSEKPYKIYNFMRFFRE